MGSIVAAHAGFEGRAAIAGRRWTCRATEGEATEAMGEYCCWAHLLDVTVIVVLFLLRISSP